MVEELTRIREDADWLELAEGEEGVIISTLSSASGMGLVFLLPDWSMMYVASCNGLSLEPLIGQAIELVVTRYEDGIYATADAVTNCLVAHGTI